jgi:RNA polymerase sigma factor (TIGR02999 family)
MDATDLLLAWSQGDESAAAKLIPLVYDELHQLARLQMRGERHDHTLQTTAIVHEAYVRLIDLSRIQWVDRAHFLAMAARMMRRVLVDHARGRASRKRGGDVRRVPFDEALSVSVDGNDMDLLALDHALEAFALVDPRKSAVVELRYFGGLSVEETAEALQVSPETVKRDWRLAKSWLLRELNGKGRR